MDSNGFLLLDIIAQNIDISRMIDNGIICADDVVNLMMVNKTWKMVLGKQLKTYMANMFATKNQDFIKFLSFTYHLEQSFLHPFRFSNYLTAINIVRTKTKGQRWRHLFKDVMKSNIFVNLENISKKDKELIVI